MFLNSFNLTYNLDILISGGITSKQIRGCLNELTSNNIIYNPKYEDGLIARKLTPSHLTF